jgi:multimeric flavodoxin WrbA
MRILGISGSPKREGFTNLLLDESLNGARAAGALTDKILLNDLSFKPCQECFLCEDADICVIPDDMAIVHAKIKEADALIVASPIYFGTITAQLKAMIDRCNSLWVAKRKLENSKRPGKTKKGAFICTAGQEKQEYFNNARTIVKILFSTIGINYSKDIFVGGLDKLTDNSPKKKNALFKSYELGLSLVKSQ